jgi:pyridoxamine 5'-phosphate oxidase
LTDDPLAWFLQWYDEAGVDSMALATASADGAPSLRMVLLKQADERGFVFFTNYASRKGRELQANPRAALLFHYPGRQVRVEGGVELLPSAESDAYWATRPLRSRAGAYASRQSQPLATREELEVAVAAAEALDPPRPEWWGGFLLRPVTYEFWIHGDDRLHDRFRFRRDGDGWVTERLSP